MKFLRIIIFHFVGAVTTLNAQPYQSTPKIDVVFWDVPLIPQPKSMSCWVTSAAMVLAWRDNNPKLSPNEIVKGHGKWENYFKNNTGLPVSELGFGTAREFFDSLGLTPLPKQCYTPEGFASYMTSGPLWVAVPGHAVVVTGVWGDGTPDGTMVYVNNPWDVDNPDLQTLHAFNDQTGFKKQNKGKQEVFTFREFTKKMEDTVRWVMSSLEQQKADGVLTDDDIFKFYSKDFYIAY